MKDLLYCGNYNMNLQAAQGLWYILYECLWINVVFHDIQNEEEKNKEFEYTIFPVFYLRF